MANDKRSIDTLVKEFYSEELIECVGTKKQTANEKRLIDANHFMKAGWHLVRIGRSNEHLASLSLADVPTVDAIPIAVIKRALSGIAAADQCDQAGRYDFELRNALRTVLKWYDSPAYKECERKTYEK